MPQDLATFHPVIQQWFGDAFQEPTPPQREGWPKIRTGRNTLIAAPTGMGKTLTAFLCLVDSLWKLQDKGELEDRCYVLYVSPLKALSNDIRINLLKPLEEMNRVAASMGRPPCTLRVAVRSGDTTPKERRTMLSQPPHILITTPESLHILLCAERSRNLLRSVQTVIWDEIHAIAGDKRGAHLALTLERLELLTRQPVQRIGLSATQKPIETMAMVLIGDRKDASGKPDCHIVNVGSHRDMELSVVLADDVLGPIATHEYWAKVYELLLQNISQHRTTIVFTHTRRMVERIAHQLSETLGKDKVAAHHGSLSKETRLQAEQRLKSGEIPVIVSSASLELGIDVGAVDLVVQIGSPKLLSTLIQRVGRSGHVTGATPKGILYPLTRDELMQAAAGVWALRRGQLDSPVFQLHPLDVLAQILVAEASCGEYLVEDLWKQFTRAFHYADLSRKDFDDVLHMLSEGVTLERGRAGAYLHYDGVHQKITGRRNARLAAITSGGTIPEAAEYDVIQEPEELFVGRVNEDFAVESMAGDIFLLGNRSWRIARVEKNRVRVIDAEGAPPTIPFWFGEAPSRSPELSGAVGDLRRKIAEGLQNPEATEAWLTENTGVSRLGARQMMDYIREGLQALGEVPSTNTVIAERFFDEAGGMQLILHTPFGGRINRAWALAMRKRFCLNFDFELQCAATDDGLLFSLGEQHSFPLDSVWQYLSPKTLQKDLIHAVLPHPIFLNRFRWNAGRALAVLRFRGGKKIPIHLQRMKTEDLLASVFPAHVGCQDNRTGPIEPVDHPLVNETLENCLQEAMDYEGLLHILNRIRSGDLKTVSVDATAPSVFSHEILNAAPYAFLDDAPLEERRSRAVSLRRVQPDNALGRLDPECIEEVVAGAAPDVRNKYELHDLAVQLGVLDEHLSKRYADEIETLVAEGRLSRCRWEAEDGNALREVGNDAQDYTYLGAVSAEKWPLMKNAFKHFKLETALPELPPLKTGTREETPESARSYILQGWMEVLGPVTESSLAEKFGWNASQVLQALSELESRGKVLQGKFMGEEKQWCARGLLMRIHQRTLQRLRQQVEPVTPADYLKFLFRWQHVHPKTKLAGAKGLLEAVEQLQGLEFPFAAWEEKILASRLMEGKPLDLDVHFLNGSLIWCRLRPTSTPAPDRTPRASRLARNFAVGFLKREYAPAFAPRDVLAGQLLAKDPLTNETVAELKESQSIREHLPPMAREILDLLDRQGALFFSELLAALQATRSSIEDGLKSLIRWGLVSGDGINGLKQLTRQGDDTSKHRGRRLKPFSAELTGRWYRWRGPQGNPLDHEERVEAWAKQLLHRYGILMREVLLRENLPLPWWQILRKLRQMEAQGRVRGGRFVRGISGEQFALPEAMDVMKTVRRDTEENIIVLSSLDPLSLTGGVFPGPRIRSNSQHYVAFKGGKLVASGLLGEVRSKLKNETAFTAKIDGGYSS